MIIRIRFPRSSVVIRMSMGLRSRCYRCGKWVEDVHLGASLATYICDAMMMGAWANLEELALGSNVGEKETSLTYMLYKDVLTVRLDTAPAFLEHHPACHEQVFSSSEFLFNAQTYMNWDDATVTGVVSQCHRNRGSERHTDRREVQ